MVKNKFTYLQGFIGIILWRLFQYVIHSMRRMYKKISDPFLLQAFLIYVYVFSRTRRTSWINEKKKKPRKTEKFHDFRM